ncbi:MAG: hypothetical protein ACREO3_06590, partial [Arenimonas sp.]
ASGRAASEAEFAHRVPLAPSLVGDVQLVARASSNAGVDAVAATIPVQSRLIEGRLTQVGWIDAQALDLRLPGLPEGAVTESLELEVRHGVRGWLEGWLVDLRDYPHRCWEQSLTRALGAAVAVDAHEPEAFWPGAAALVESVIADAPSFQGEDGRFHYFLSTHHWIGEGSPVLSAWTLRSFDRLRAMGYVVPKQMYAELETAVQLDAVPPPDPGKDGRDWVHEWEIAAVASGALAGSGRVRDDNLQRIWQRWDRLSWHGRTELVRAMARAPALAARTGEGLALLRAAGHKRGLRQVIDDDRDFGYAMGSSLRDQCAVVATLYELDASPAGEPQRQALLRGVADLYAGGTSSLDTQSSIHCVLAMQAAARKLPRDSAAGREVQAILGTARQALALAADESPTTWRVPAPFTGDSLQLRGPETVDPTLNFAATINYNIDALAAPAQATGLRLERRYAVFREGKWRDLPDDGMREGEWVRVTLRVTVPAWRYFVAITDPVPGGLVTRDLALAGVGDAALRDAGDRGSWWFDSRQTGATDVRMYAESLPAGVHEVHYFAQAVHPGDYLAPPAVAELMYGRSSRATTSGQRLRIEAGQ